MSRTMSLKIFEEVYKKIIDKQPLIFADLYLMVSCKLTRNVHYNSAILNELCSTLTRLVLIVFLTDVFDSLYD